MNRREPPPVTQWMLEHLTSGDRDEALFGDLLEEFRIGRSVAWYWQQVISACAVSWFSTLQAHLPLLFFSLVWSVPAPAWKALCDQIQDSQIVVNAWPLFGGLWAIPALVLWALLHSIFLWSGMAIYLAVHGALGHQLRENKVRSAMLWAPLVFAVIFGALFVLFNLYWYSIPGLAGQKLASTPLWQVADLGLLADAVRYPYFLTLLLVLWGAIPTSPRNLERFAPTSSLAESADRPNSVEPETATGAFAAKRYFALMVSAGLMNAMIISFLLCRLPESHAPTLTSIFLRAVVFVGLGALAGVAGTWVYWNGPWSHFENSPRFHFHSWGLCAPRPGCGFPLW